MMEESFVPYRKAAAYLQQQLLEAGLPLPKLGVICGSGLSGLSDALEGKTLSVSYGKIVGFPAHCTVAGHKGEVVFGSLSGVPTMCFRGRFHSYEGYDMKTVVLPVHVMRCLGVKIVIVTNAAGGLNSTYKVGDIICVTDHFALPHLAGKNSLVGPNDTELGPRFPATSNAYPRDIREAAAEAAKKLKFDFFVNSGTYCFVSGPMYESPAECRFLKGIGGDVVGMSTVPEIVAAHHAGMKVLCLSLVTNIVIAETDSKETANHQEVLETVKRRSGQMQMLVKEAVEGIGTKVLNELPGLPPVSLENGFWQKKSDRSNLVYGVLFTAAIAGVFTLLVKAKR